MAGKKRKKTPVRPVVSLRVRLAMYDDLVREAEKRRIKLSEEVERRLLYYESTTSGFGELSGHEAEVYKSFFDREDMLDEICERIARKLESRSKMKPAKALKERKG